MNWIRDAIANAPHPFAPAVPGRATSADRAELLMRFLAVDLDTGTGKRLGRIWTEFCGAIVLLASTTDPNLRARGVGGLCRCFEPFVRVLHTARRETDSGLRRAEGSARFTELIEDLTGHRVWEWEQHTETLNFEEAVLLLAYRSRNKEAHLAPIYTDVEAMHLAGQVLAAMTWILSQPANLNAATAHARVSSRLRPIPEGWVGTQPLPPTGAIRPRRFAWAMATAVVTVLASVAVYATQARPRPSAVEALWGIGISTVEQARAMPAGKVVKLIVTPGDLKFYTSRNGFRHLTFTSKDATGDAQCIVYAGNLREADRALLSSSKPVVILAKTSAYKDDLSLIVQSVVPY